MTRALHALFTLSWILFVAGPGALAQAPQVYYTPSAGAAASTPSAPSLQYVSGGTLGVSNYYVKLTYVSPGGETTASLESSLLSVPANNLLVIASPAGANATGWKPYVWTSSGNEELQSLSGCTLNSAGNACAIGSSWTEPTGGLSSGSTPPSTNTTGLYINLSVGTFFCGPNLVQRVPAALQMSPSVNNYVYLDAICAYGSAVGAYPANTVQLGVVGTNGTGVISVTPAASWLPHSPTMVDVSTLSGATAGDQISSCIGALPSTGGTCDARGLTGAQTISTDIFSGLAKPIVLLLGQSTVTVSVPITPPVGIGLMEVIGSGQQTILTPLNSNQAVIQGPSSGTAVRDFFSDFVVKAHVSGSGGPAINMTGFDSTTFQDIVYQSNGSGTWTSWFQFYRSGSQYCYNNFIIRPFMQGQIGPATVFAFLGDGTDSGNNANLQHIVDATIVSNTGITRVVDALRSYGVVISGGDIESNTVATGVIRLGSKTEIDGLSCEGNGAGCYEYGTASDGVSDQDSILTNSGGDSSIFPVDVNYHSVIVGAAYAHSGFGGKVQYRDDTGTTRWFAGLPGSAGATSFAVYDTVNSKLPFTIETNTPTSTLYVNSSGQVGVGTASPGSALHVGAGAALSFNGVVPQINNVQTSGQAALGVLVNDGPNNLRASFFADGTNGVWGLFSNFHSSGVPFTISQQGAEVFRITNPGNVGIGTTSPAIQLQVAKAMAAGVNDLDSPSGPVAFDASAGNTFRVKLTASKSSSWATGGNPVAGQELLFIICQDSVGGHTFSWPSNVKGGMSIDSNPSACSSQSFVYDGVNQVAYATSNLQPTIALSKGSGAGNYTSTSTTYTDVDATNLAYTVVIPTGWKLSVTATGSITTNTAIVTAWVCIADGGTTFQETSVRPTLAGTSGAESFALGWVVSGDGGSHTIKLRYKTSNTNDAVLIQNSSATLLPTMVFELRPSN